LFYSGKQKRHTLKAQVVVDYLSGLIICTAFGKGRFHDFRLFKEHRIPFGPDQMCLVDRGYQGIAKFHGESYLPHKKKRGEKLTSEQRRFNRRLAQIRVKVEHVNRKLKIFRILSERYRNRRKRFGLRFNLISGLLNYELIHPI
jgi:hypothetical protein